MNIIHIHQGTLTRRRASFFLWLACSKLRAGDYVGRVYEQIYYSQVHRCACSVRHFNHKLQILIWVVLKIMKRFLNFATLPSASQQRVPVLSEKIIEICLIFIKNQDILSVNNCFFRGICLSK